MSRVELDGVEDIFEEPSDIVIDTTKRSKNYGLNGKRIRQRNWCFTSFAVDDNNELIKPVFNGKAMKYLLFAPEECPTTGKRHYQGYVQMLQPILLTSIRTFLPIGTHLQTCRGDATQNYAYIAGPYYNGKTKKTKPCNPNFEEYGDMVHERQRTDLIKFAESHRNFEHCVADEPLVSLTCSRMLKDYYKAKGAKYDVAFTRPMVIWFWGPTGVDKSVSCREIIKYYHIDYLGQTCWTSPETSGTWFDGYVGQDVAFYDEIREDTLPLRTWLRILDWDAPQVAVKGGFTDFRPKFVYITSPFHPLDLHFEDRRDDIAQLGRRCDVIRHVGPTYRHASQDPTSEWFDDKYSDRGVLPIDGGSINVGERPYSIWKAKVVILQETARNKELSASEWESVPDEDVYVLETSLTDCDNVSVE